MNRTITGKRSKRPAFLPVDQGNGKAGTMAREARQMRGIQSLANESSRVAGSIALQGYADASPVVEQSGTVQMMADAAAQREAASPANQVLQAYTLSPDGMSKISENLRYRTSRYTAHLLDVKPGSLGPQPAALFRQVRGTRDGYDRYQLSGRFQNDCLEFAEYLAHQKYLKGKTGFTAKGDGRSFGDSDKTNMAIGKTAGFDEKELADPSVGEAFTAVRMEIEADVCPYHVAMVVATDGNDRVTCEADAGSALNDAVFDMYNVGKLKGAAGSMAITVDGDTFYTTYKDMYTTAKGQLPATGVLVPKVIV